MTANYNKKNEMEIVTYQIRIEGHIDCQWSEWFDDLVITYEEGGATLLTGAACDQAALYGLLKKVRDLGLFLISVNRVEPTLGKIAKDGSPSQIP